jgi:hypothetical protein
MDKWNLHVAKWTGWAQEKGMSVQFDYWGEHDLLVRLSRQEHRGRFFFWFRRELFSDQWFRERLDEAIAGAGPRYTPQLNVDLPIARLFDELGRTSAFFKRLDGEVQSVAQAYRPISQNHLDLFGIELNTLKRLMQELSLLTRFDQDNVDVIDWPRMKLVLEAASTEASSLIERIEFDGKTKIRTASKDAQATHGVKRNTITASEVRRYMRALRTLIGSIQGARLTNEPALILVGGGGMGKTHLFCDVAHHRQQQAQPTILLLGEKFRDSEPWTQIMSMLSLSCERDEFLGALNAAGEARRQRALILIEALNEGEGKRFWRSYLAEILITLTRYPWVGIAFSVRSSYEEIIVPEGLVPDRLVRAVHEGFVDHEYEATKTYFDHYRIERPSIPLLFPEFRNPLFLKLFCQGLRAGNYTRIPEGLVGITTIFNFFLENLNSKLVRLEELDLNPKVPYVGKAVQELSRTLAERGVGWLPHEEAQAIVDNIAPPKGYDRSLFYRLISEGVLSEDRFPEYGGNSERTHYVEGIRFAYERLSDHLIAQYLLDASLDVDQPYKPFEPGGPLGRLFSSDQAQWQNRGLIEAISIQLPERISMELCQLLPAEAVGEVVRTALVESLLWRDPASITKKTRQYITQHALPDWRTFQQFLEVLLAVSMNPRHPLNADYLHTRLKGQSMAERDAWWSTFLYEQYDNGLHSPVNRLIDWAWKVEEISHVEDEPLRLAALVLSWFLSTSHRPLRDRATKALVRLLEARLHVIRQLLDAFEDVDDPYVTERLYAVAYGCAMRSQNHVGLKELAQDVYQRVFDQERSPSNILLRDHARGVIERALALNLDVVITAKKIHPPYLNTWPEAIPSQEEVEQLLGVEDRVNQEMSFKERGRFALYFSLMGWGDFARYIIGTDSASYKWSARRLADAKMPSRKEEYRHFMSSLTPKQRHAVERYREIYWQIQHHHLVQSMSQLFQESRVNGETRNEYDLAVKALTQTPELSLEEALHRLEHTVGKRKTALFKKQGFSWTAEPEEPEGRLDLKLFQRWIAKRVFKLGWTLDRFGEFDALVDQRVNGNGGRSPDKPERIGKKYQWIAYYDILARATDTFIFRDDYWNDDDFPYIGPWQFSSVRNIDPSFLQENTRADKGMSHISTGNWWYPPAPDWYTELDDKLWLQGQYSLPDPCTLIEVTRTVDASAWLTLYGHYPWKQPPLSEEKGNGPQGREVWYFLESCLVKRAHAQQLFTWAKLHDLATDHLPEPTDWDNIYLGELYWSPCYNFHSDPVRRYREWTRGEGEKFPVPLTSTAERYSWSRQYDCSIEETLSCMVPSKFLADGMRLFWNGQEGHYIDSVGKLTVFDPSVYEAGPSVLLVRKDAFFQFLQENDLAVLWTVRGEKNAYGNGDWPASFAGRYTITGAYMYAHLGSLQGKLLVKDSSKK